ncbi:MAG: hypothetical protein IT500_00235, partial [Rubrivivax sp.]|nr:hypothetical protein [Rubrivivax sp.]
MFMRLLGLITLALGLLTAHGPASAAIWDSVPDEQLKALELSRDASPKELFDRLSKRY